jgi:C-terminal processing protease CtpA/Prc
MFSRLEFLGGMLAAAAAPAAGMRPALSPSAMVEDLRTFARVLQEIGAEPFRTSSREAFMAELARAEAVCAAPRTADEFYVALAGLSASLNDGHVSIDGWKSRAEHDDAGGGELPLRTVVDEDDALVVGDDLSDEGGVEPGSVVTRIEGHDAAHIVALAMRLRGGQTPALRRAFARILDAVYLTTGPHAAGQPYEVEIVDPAGSRRVRRFAAVTQAVRNERYAAKNPPLAPYADRGMIGHAAVCDYNACQDAAKFHEFLSAFFARARSGKARAVVVDIRRNGGGNSSVNDALFPFVSAKAYRQYGGMRVRSNDWLKREYGREKYIAYYGDKAWNAANGELVEYSFDPPRAPAAEPARFDGPSFLLIGPGTFSSAMACASAAKAYGLMQLAGEPTGEPVYSTGEVYELALPRTGFSAHMTTKVWLPPEPLPAGSGVIPDIVVPTTRADRRARRDPVLDAVLARVR